VKKFIAGVVTVAALQGCAYGDANLKVAHGSGQGYKGPMSQVQPLMFVVQPLEDARQDKERIGYKKNGFGQNTASITTTTPVADIVASGVRTGLQVNGHTLGEQAQVTVSGAVTRFWFEFDPNFFTVGFIGNVEARLAFADAKGQKFYDNVYSGTYKTEKAGGLEATWTEVMSMAVDKLVEDVMFDADLIEALESRKAAAAAAPAGAAQAGG
jgi:hypothetical protein